MLFSHLKVSSSHLLIHTKTLSLSVFTHSTWWKSETIIKENEQLSCLLTIAADFCITVWQIVHIFRQKSKHLQMCHHSQKRLSLQFSHRVTTQLKFSKNWQLSCLLTCSDNFFITMSQTVYSFRQKLQNICKSLKTVRKDSAYQFSHRVTQLKFSKN
jgi:hypothetical protein